MPDLAADIADDPRHQRVVEDRERAAARARENQALHRLLTRVFIVATALAAVSGGLVLYGVNASEDASSPLVAFLARDSVNIGLVTFQGLCLAAAAACAYLLRARRPAQRWIEERLKAEAGRLERARRVLEIGHEKGGDAFANAGAWFLGFVKGQRDHLEKSSRRRDRSALTLAFGGAAVAGLAALASAMAGLRHEAVVVGVAILGVCAPALVSAVKSWGEATADEERAALHARTLEELQALRDGEPAFKDAIASQDLDGALEWAEQVFEALRRDHAGFAKAHAPSIGANGAAGG